METNCHWGKVHINSSVTIRGEKMVILMIILVAMCVFVELLLFVIHMQKEKKKKDKMRRNLYKLIEERVLDQALKYRITNTEAAMRECNSPFLYMEFLNTKPLISYLFPLDEWITIGRNKENKICVHDEMFSRLHCKIGLVNNVILLQDQGSVNGVRVRRGLLKKIDVSSGGYAMLESGDRIRIGNCRIKIQIVYGTEAIN